MEREAVTDDLKYTLKVFMDKKNKLLDAEEKRINTNFNRKDLIQSAID